MGGEKTVVMETKKIERKKKKKKKGEGLGRGS